MLLNDFVLARLTFGFFASIALATSLYGIDSSELRGAWVPSVYNLSFPSRAGLSVAEQKSEIVHLLDVAQSLHLNAVFFQVRPECDALYASTYEPWSRYLTGHQGFSPGYDPLTFMIQEGTKRHIGIHAWFNPYRAAATASKPLADNHPANKLAAVTYQIDSSLWMDPGSPAVQDEVVRVVMDVVTRYNIAGVHLDDYFYPYPSDPSTPVHFPDGATYKSYRISGGQLSRSDWRRENVNQLIQRLSIAIKAAKPQVLFGVSPFGIYRPGCPRGVTANLDQFETLSSDPVMWMREGWVDYLAPQLYWPDQSDQSFSALLSWWRDSRINPRGIPIYPGIALERLDPPYNWPTREILHQVRLTRQIHASNQTSTGFILWNIKSLLLDTKDVRSTLQDELVE